MYASVEIKLYDDSRNVERVIRSVQYLVYLDGFEGDSDQVIAEQLSRKLEGYNGDR